MTPLARVVAAGVVGVAGGLVLAVLLSIWFDWRDGRGHDGPIDDWNPAKQLADQLGVPFGLRPPTGLYRWTCPSCGHTHECALTARRTKGGYGD